jgi:hypothetical protein
MIEFHVEVAEGNPDGISDHEIRRQNEDSDLGYVLKTANESAFSLVSI